MLIVMHFLFSYKKLVVVIVLIISVIIVVTVIFIIVFLFILIHNLRHLLIKTNIIMGCFQKNIRFLMKKFKLYVIINE